VKEKSVFGFFVLFRGVALQRADRLSTQLLLAMSEEMLMHFSSNSNQSDPSLPVKLAKLEARMAGKATSTPVQSSWQSSPVKAAAIEEVVGPSSSSTDSDDDIGGEFLIQPNPQKRQRYNDGEEKSVFKQSEMEIGLPLNLWIFKLAAGKSQARRGLTAVEGVVQ